MKYKLTIIKYEGNKDYEAEMAKWKENGLNRNYNQLRPWDERQSGEPERETAERSLEVFLTEDEYKKVKEEVIKVFQ